MTNLKNWTENKTVFYAVFAVITALFIGLYNGLLLGNQIFTHDSFIWLGSYYYFMENLVAGHYPFWDPYSLTGTPFYPYIHTHGLLDPIVYLSYAMVKFLGSSTLTSYVYFYLFRLLAFAVGAYYLYKHVSGSRLAALVAAGVLVFAVAPTAFRQMGILENVFLTPLTLYFLLKTIDGIASSGKGRYTYLAALGVCIGISVNVFIPAYFTFNLIVFVIVLFAAGLKRFSEIKPALSDKRFIVCAAVVAALVVLMALPSAVLFRESRSPENEHFPSVRIIQKNDGLFKQMVASDVSGEVLSTKFTNSKGVYSSYGNLINLIYPDFWMVYGVSIYGPKEGFNCRGDVCPDLISEAFQYIGIIPFLAAVFGFLFARNRYRFAAAAMLIVISINMLSAYGVHGRPPNWLQSAFNAVFPPLKMMEVRETLSGFFLLYLCMLFALGIKDIIEGAEFRQILTLKWKRTLLVLITVFVAKAVFTLSFFEIKGGWLRAFYMTPMDGAIYLFVVLFALLLYFYRKSFLSKAMLAFVIFLLTFYDLYYYNQKIKALVLKDNVLQPALNAYIIASKGRGDFEYFRVPFVATSEPLAFAESILKKKGAMSKGNNHQMLTTKRFYDLFTNMPLQKQFLSAGTAYPVVRFFPAEDSEELKDRRAVLERLSSAGDDELTGKLFLENEKTTAAAVNTSEVKTFDSYPNADWLKQAAISTAFDSFIALRLKGGLDGLQRGLDGYLRNMNAQISVTGFSTNSLSVSVDNKVPGYFQYNDGWSRYWKAYDNGAEIPLRVANYNSKAVFLSPGTHSLSFVYDPSHYRRAVILYHAGLVGLFGLIAATHVYGRRGDVGAGRDGQNKKP